MSLTPITIGMFHFDPIERGTHIIVTIRTGDVPGERALAGCVTLTHQDWAYLEVLSRLHDTAGTARVMLDAIERRTRDDLTPEQHQSLVAIIEVLKMITNAPTRGAALFLCTTSESSLKLAVCADNATRACVVAAATANNMGVYPATGPSDWTAETVYAGVIVLERPK